jgi:hypothetical protein
LARTRQNAKRSDASSNETVKRSTLIVTVGSEFIVVMAGREERGRDKRGRGKTLYLSVIMKYYDRIV